MKDNRYVWMVEVTLRDGSWCATEEAHMYRDDARRHAKTKAHWEKMKARVVKYVPEKK